VGVDKLAVRDEMNAVRTEFRGLWERARPPDLRRSSAGTRWTNKQLLYHMLFGYLVVQALLILVRLFGRLPRGVGHGFAGLLNAGARPFHVINYLGSRAGGTVLSGDQMVRLLDWAVQRLQRRLELETDADLARGMCYPTKWDPFFREFMTLADIYRFPTQHFEFHRRQLTL
jgi:DinB superfamily